MGGYGWRATYVIAGLPGILIAAALLLAQDPRELKEAEAVVAKDLTRKLSYGFIERQEVSESTGKSYPRLVLSAFTQPSMLLLFLAAAFRHTAGYTWAHNNVSYFSQYHQGREIGYWFMICAIAGGSVGVFVGGYISDLVVTRLGLYSRLWLLGVCTVVATPFAVLTLHLDPPHAFGTLLLYYFFAETWFAILFTVLVEIVPSSIRSVCIGTFLFLMNNVGGEPAHADRPPHQGAGHRPSDSPLHHLARAHSCKWDFVFCGEHSTLAVRTQPGQADQPVTLRTYLFILTIILCYTNITTHNIF